MIFRFLFLILSWALSLHSALYFLPPPGWELAKPTQENSHVQLSLLGSPDPQSGFCPSINFATEAIDLSSSEYLKIVKKLHGKKAGQICRDLGTFQTDAGPAHLLCVDAPASEGDIRLMQLIYFEEGRASILTAGVLKKNFLSLLPTIQKAFQSLTRVEDLLDAIPDPTQREKWRQRCLEFSTTWKKSSDTVTSLKQFEETLGKEYPSLGIHWRLLLLQNVTGS